MQTRIQYASTFEGFGHKTRYPPKSENRVSAGIVLPRGGQFYTKRIVARNALSAMPCKAEVADLWQNALNVTHET